MYTKLTQQIVIQCVWYNIGAEITFDGTLRLPDKEWQLLLWICLVISFYKYISQISSLTIQIRKHAEKRTKKQLKDPQTMHIRRQCTHTQMQTSLDTWTKTWEDSQKLVN